MRKGSFCLINTWFAHLTLSSLCFSCWDSNPRPPEHESSTVTSGSGSGPSIFFIYLSSIYSFVPVISLSLSLPVYFALCSTIKIFCSGNTKSEEVVILIVLLTIKDSFSVLRPRLLKNKNNDFLRAREKTLSLDVTNLLSWFDLPNKRKPPRLDVMQVC